jgi:hypothetical protein
MRALLLAFPTFPTGLLLLAASAHAQAPAPAPPQVQLAALAPIPAALPDAPDAASLQQDSAQAATASVSGLVEDVNGGIVPAATITLTRIGSQVANPAPDAAALPSATSSATGQFTLSGLPPGNYQLSASAPGFETYISSTTALRPGQHLTFGQIALPIATASSSVTVHVTQVELAHEQVKAEEKQRVLGILPNFYSSYIWNAAPLSTGQKFSLASRALIDPVNFLGSGVAAGIQQWQNTYKDYGQGAQGYAKRYGADFTDGVLGRMIGSAILPSLLHQDPRYFYLGSGTRKQRIIYALTRSVITRGDNGQYQPNYSGVLGDLSAGAISNAYRPASDRGLGLTFGNAALNTLGNAASNLVREFILRGFVPSVPTYAQGRKEGPIPNALTP